MTARHEIPAFMPCAMASSDVAYWLIAAWLFVTGGIIGSFLNVVVYRLPAGISIVSPGSHCPACKRAIRWFDNVPVFGWLWLGGRCRDCRAAISPRYPLVEAGTAVLFLAIGMADYFGYADRLLAGPADGSGDVIFFASAVAQLLGICAWHLMLLCTLLCAALIEYDGHRPPWRLFAPALAVGMVASPLWPLLHPLPAWPGWSGWAAGLRDGAVGLAAGLLLGRLATALQHRGQESGFRGQGTEDRDQGPGVGSQGLETEVRSTKYEVESGLPPSALRAAPSAVRAAPSVETPKGGLLLGMACVGLYLGWQAVCVLALATMAIHVLLWALGRSLPALRRIPATAWLTLATLVWILCWAR